MLHFNRYYIIFTFVFLFCNFTIFGQCNITSVVTDPEEPVMMCEGDSAIFHFNANGNCSGQYEFRVSTVNLGTIIQNWTNIDSVVVQPADSTNYVVEARCSGCPTTIVTDTFIVVVTHKPIINPFPEICGGETVTITATPTGNETLSWWDNNVLGSSNQLSNNGTVTTPPFEDTTTIWVRANSSSSAGGGVGRVLITEVGLEGSSSINSSNDYVEITNLFNVPVNTTGWVVAVSSSYSNINSVNNSYWNLPNSFAPCTIDERRDEYGGSDYWGSNIMWDPNQPGWVVILDNNGQIIDAIFWGWSAYQITSFNININGFNVTYDPNAWTGVGVNANCGTNGSVMQCFSRTGNSDNNNAGDFVCQPTSLNVINPGLSCGWSASKSCYYPAKVLVTPIPMIDPINDTSACGSLELPVITGSDLTGYEAFYTASGGNGTVYHPGDAIITSQTIYVYDSTHTSTQCTDEISFYVAITPDTMQLEAGNDLEICEGTEIMLNATGTTVLSWDNGITNGVPFIPPVDTTKYIVEGINGACFGKDSLIVLVHPTPEIKAGNDTALCEGNPIILSGQGGETYVWNNGVQDHVSFIPPVGITKYKVEGTDQYGCTSEDSLNVEVFALPDVAFKVDTTLGCMPFGFTFTNQTPGNITSAIWYFSNGDTAHAISEFTHILNQTACYDVKLIITNDKGCVDSLRKNDFICIAPDPVASFVPRNNQLNTLNPSTEMVNHSTGAIDYIWDFGDNSPFSNEFEPKHSFPPNKTETYFVILTAINSFGCIDSTMMPINMRELLLFYVPNSFTPDGDGINDKFQPIINSGVNPYDYVFYVYNRWGELIFESHNTEVGWDGSFNGHLAPNGTYIWKMSFKLQDTDERQKHHGIINLID